MQPLPMVRHAPLRELCSSTRQAAHPTNSTNSRSVSCFVPCFVLFLFLFCSCLCLVLFCRLIDNASNKRPANTGRRSSVLMCRVQLDFSANSCVVLTIFWSRWTVGRSCRSTPGRETDEACLSSGRQECGARTAATGNDTTRKYLVSGARCVLHQSRETSTKATTVSVGF